MASDTRSWRRALNITGAAYIGAGTVGIIAVLAFWRPCFGMAGFDGAGCVPRQSEFDGGPGTALAIAWGAAIVVALVSTFLAWSWNGPTGPYLAILPVLAAGFPLFDYALTASLLGGYRSHDDPPGLGAWNSASVTVAGVLLLASAVGRRTRRCSARQGSR